MTALRRGERGFTLLEVIVAMALFAAGIVMISRLFTGSLRLSAGARDASAGAIYARQRMEEALLVPNPVEGAEKGTFGDDYRWEVATSFVPQEEETAYDEIRVRVAVRWDDGGDERAVDLSATRWRRKETGEGSLSAGSAPMPTATVAGSGGIPVAGSGGIPVAGSGGVPVAGSGGIPVAGSGGSPAAGSGGVPAAGSGGGPVEGSGGEQVDGRRRFQHWWELRRR